MISILSFQMTGVKKALLNSFDYLINFSPIQL